LANPQFKTLTSLDAINKIKDILIPIAEPKIQGLQIPDVSGQISAIGVEIDYHISNIVVTSFAFGPTNVILFPLGVSLDLPQCQTVLNMNWQYKGLGLSGSGSATDSLSIQAVALILIGETQGKPQVSVNSLQLNIDKIDITVHGGESWFYQIFVTIFKSKIKSVVQSAIQSQITNVVDQIANYYLKNTPTVYQIIPQIGIDYSLTSPPNIQPSYSSTAHLGEFQWSHQPAPCIYQPSVIPEELVPGKLLTFLVAETLGDCLGTLLYMNNILGGTITSKMVPSSSPIALNTSNYNWRTTVPQLYNLYPDTDMDLYVMSAKAPVVGINAFNQTITADLDGLVRVQVQKNNTQDYIPVFTLEITLHVEASLSVTSGNVITGTVKSISHNTTIVSSNIGNLNLHGLDVMVSVFLNLGIVPIIDNALAKGFPIPNIEGIQLRNAVINYKNGFLQVGSDFDYNPTKLNQFLMAQRK
jgi:lipopolysaccharide-binding protein